jgi:ABC-2 type transport system permease protein
MWTLAKKEWQHFFGNLTGYIAMTVFLVLCGLWLFFFPDTNLLDYGYASLQPFFEVAPWLMIMLIPTITMRSFAEELKSGTFELLRTYPLSNWQLVFGKYLGMLAVIFLTLLPTCIYPLSIQMLSSRGGIDWGATAGSYLGLFLLASCFAAIGLYASSLTHQVVVAFVVGAFLCFMVYVGLEAVSKLPIFSNQADFYIQQLGLQEHYKSISRGVIELRDVLYYVIIIALFLGLTKRQIQMK